MEQAQVLFAIGLAIFAVAVVFIPLHVAMYMVRHEMWVDDIRSQKAQTRFAIIGMVACITPNFLIYLASAFAPGSF